MQVAPLPDDEEQRLAKLFSFGVLDTLPQKAFDEITTLASAICGTPIALISFVDRDRQWFKSRIGLDPSETEREVAFCSHAILRPKEVLVVEDATQDQRFHDNPLVTSDPGIRFYAGAPIVSDDGFALGTVCVIDRQPRHIDAAQQQALCALASLVVTLLKHEHSGREESERRAATMLRRNEYLTALSTSGLDLMSFVDTNYIYRYVNQTYLSYWAREPVDIVNRSVQDLLGKALFQTTKTFFDQALAGEQVDFEATIDFPGKGTRHVEVTYLPARDNDGSISGVIVRTHDIQKLKEREEQLRSTVAMLEHKTLEQERFIHIISHDLREPINTINNFASLLAEDESLGQSAMARRNLHYVQAGGRRMASLLDDLLNFLHLEEHALNLKPIDLNQIAEEVQEDLNAALQRSGGRIEVGHLPTTVGDASLLRIALQNLVANGLKFARKGVPPLVRIASKTEGDWLHIEVQDNGIGMHEHQLANIFEMFKRLHSGKEYDGTGLGLSICRRITELHHGRVSVRSDPGKGSCFSLSLPHPTTGVK
ncbi:hypothetical protein LPB72_09565 [Hydrogenophaga crassostreae]|uniref:histidine kinase n=1 Tax=Hydrogenophaga crassostreae TaxID=1763535 RepID=A0A167HPV4_9BURK|nr:ATP-binding protein [Hydrogenophaga crassostreae]AOW13294.1 hypothetical protein LPB072_10950 [Hydrogenophaga crassostreae]OAD41575.1 hypothetical protein LPB72_09565 [Hydrogenophaga crassostreae]